MNEMIDIGDVIAQTGVPASTLHLWERKGLISPVARAGLRRQYEAKVIDIIATIVVSQRSGFTLAEIAELLNPASVDDKSLLALKLTALREQQLQLDMAITGLEHALSCSHANLNDCPEFNAVLRRVLPVDPKDRDRDRGN